MSAATQVASLYGTLTLKDEATGALQNAVSGFQSFGGKIQSAGMELTKFGGALGIVTTPLALLGKQAYNTASSFDSAMAEISARTGIVGEDLTKISDFALQMGADTAFSAQEAADGFLQLLSSGQSAEQAITTLSTVMDLAAASGEDLGQTADVLTDILAAFGLPIDASVPAIEAMMKATGATAEMFQAWDDELGGVTPEMAALADETGYTVRELQNMINLTEDATSVADALAKAAGASSADIASLGQGFGNVGPVAKNFGMSVEETAATLALLSENGIKGSEAGTALKSMLMNMTRTTPDVTAAWGELGTSFYDSEGNARDLDTVLLDIKKSMKGMPVEKQNRLIQDLAGSYGSVAMMALLGNTSIDDMIDLMDEQATASEVAGARLDTMAGDADALSGSIETLQIKAFTPFMNNTLRPLVQDITGVINSMAAWAAANPETMESIVKLGAAIIALAGGALAAGTVLAGIGAIIGMLVSPIGLVIAAIVAMKLAYDENLLGFRDFVNNILGDVEKLAGDIKTAFEEGGLEGVGKLIIGQLSDSLPDLAVWAIDNIAFPIINAVIGIDWTKVGETGLNLLQAVADGLGDIGFWLRINLVYPVIEALMWADWSSVLYTGLHILAKIAEAFIGISKWVLDKILTPLATAIIDQAKVVYDKAVELGKQILQGILDALVSLPAKIAELIGSAIPDSVLGIDLSLGSTGPSMLGGLSPSTVTGAGGTAPMRDSGGYGRAGEPYLIGTGAQPELFIPQSSGSFYPAGAYGGDGGAQTIQVMLGEETLFEAVINEGARRDLVMVRA
jgi:hypothetical protein